MSYEDDQTVPSSSIPIPSAHTLMNVNNRNTTALPSYNNSNSIQDPPIVPNQPVALALNGTTVTPTSVINLSNSNDVVIGPMTQYQGAVTIYQYMDATVEASNRFQPNVGTSLNRKPKLVGKTQYRLIDVNPK